MSKIVGRNRELTRGFLLLESHFLFSHRFCNPGRGNEKGNVEGAVGYARRNFMVPVPEAKSFLELNEGFRRRCRMDLDRKIWGQRRTKAELLEEDRAAMLGLPGVSFDARRTASGRANSFITGAVR